jgi:hypothetical protein
MASQGQGNLGGLVPSRLVQVDIGTPALDASLLIPMGLTMSYQYESHRLGAPFP